MPPKVTRPSTATAPAPIRPIRPRIVSPTRPGGSPDPTLAGRDRRDRAGDRGSVRARDQRRVGAASPAGACGGATARPSSPRAVPPPAVAIGAPRRGVVRCCSTSTCSPAEQDALLADARPALVLATTSSPPSATPAPRGAPVELAPAPARPMIYTSGTTGMPKGCVVGADRRRRRRPAGRRSATSGASAPTTSTSWPRPCTLGPTALRRRHPSSPAARWSCPALHPGLVPRRWRPTAPPRPSPAAHLQRLFAADAGAFLTCPCSACRPRWCPVSPPTSGSSGGCLPGISVWGVLRPWD